MMAVNPGGGGPGGAGDGDDPGDQKGYYSDHWGHGHHKGDAEYIERNSEAIAQSIINWASAQHLPNDTKIVVNYDLGGGYQRYFIVVVFYHTGPPRYVNFHSSRRSNVRGNAQGEPDTVVYNTNWRNNWK
jgi:hypothetical protein